MTLPSFLDVINAALSTEASLHVFNFLHRTIAARLLSTTDMPFRKILVALACLISLGLSVPGDTSIYICYLETTKDASPPGPPLPTCEYITSLAGECGEPCRYFAIIKDSRLIIALSVNLADELLNKTLTLTVNDGIAACLFYE